MMVVSLRPLCKKIAAGVLAMPELPDITVYVERLEKLVQGHTLGGIRFASPFLLRSVDPPVSAVAGLKVRRLRRLGKRIVFELDTDGPIFVVLHLMIDGRLQW